MELPKDTKDLLEEQLGEHYDQLIRLIGYQSSSSEDTGEYEPINHLEYFKSRFPERYKEKPNCILQPVALVTYDDPYVQSLVVNAFKEMAGIGWKVIESRDDGDYHYHFSDYEHINWFSSDFEGENFICSCYYDRKGLIRKALVAKAVRNYELKKNLSLAPKTIVFFSKAAEGELTKNEVESHLVDSGIDKDHDSQIYIVKPSMTNQAQGIFLARGKEELCSKICASCDELGLLGGIAIQHYIDPWLINGFKFHLRVFVVLIGNLKAFVYQPMLSIFSIHDYKKHEDDLNFTKAHLTNISHQGISNLEEQHKCMRLFDEKSVLRDISQGDDIDHTAATALVQSIKSQVNTCVKHVVTASTAEVSFLAKSNCFEIFGFDFLVNKEKKVVFLEANAEPDLAKAGERLQPIIDQLLQDTIYLTTSSNKFPKQILKETEKAELEARMKLVLEQKLSF